MRRVRVVVSAHRLRARAARRAQASRRVRAKFQSRRDVFFFCVDRRQLCSNDVVVVVFNESGGAFNPATLTSHFNHVVCVVTPCGVDAAGVPLYRSASSFSLVLSLMLGRSVGFASKLGVRPFGPFLPVRCGQMSCVRIVDAHARPSRRRFSVSTALSTRSCSPS